jgi:acyl carrier protein
MRADRHGENRLVGYFTPDGESPSVDDLRKHLRASLPDYMIPTAWAPLDSFPMNNDGWKINRAALPEPPDSAGDRDIAAPRTPIEMEVARCVTDVLGLARIGADENFFDVGGNSLQALRIVSRLNKTFDIRISVRLLYGTATLAGVAAAINELIEAKAHA